MIPNLKIFHNKINQFINQYYKNQLINGFFIGFGIFIVLLLLIFTIEYFLYTSIVVRTIIFYTFLSGFLIFLIFSVGLPYLKIKGLIKRMSSQDVADMIGRYFPEIDDKILNTLQLEEQYQNTDNQDLIIAAMDRKIEKITPFQFSKAINLKRTRNIIKYSLIPVILFLLIFTIKSEVILDSGHRIIHHQQFFEKPAPYHIEILNSKLAAFQNDVFLLEVKVIGDEIPDELFIFYQGKTFKMTKNNQINFSYQFKNLQQNLSFYIYSQEHRTKDYELIVFPKPVLIKFKMDLVYPDYINKPNETIENNGNISVPQGTQVNLTVFSKNTDTVELMLNHHLNSILPQNNQVKYSFKIKEYTDFYILTKNKYGIKTDTLHYAIEVIPDRFPEIQVEQQTDSLFRDRIYFKGVVKDDYGFSALYFVYSKTDEHQHKISDLQKIPIRIMPLLTLQEFYYYIDPQILNLQQGEKADYYFEVWDNDKINGSKSAVSQIQTIKHQTEQELNETLEASNEEAKSLMNDIMKESNQLLKEIKQLQRKLKETKQPGWQEQKKLEEALEKFQQLKKEIQQLKKQQEQQKQVENQYKDYSQDILDLQKELQKRYDEILSDDMKKMLEDLERMMNQLDKYEMQMSTDKIQMSTEDIKKSMDQQLQLFKQLEFSKKQEDIIQKVKTLATEQQQLSEEAKHKTQDNQSLLKQQEQISQKFQNIQEDIQKLHQLNSELEETNKILDTKQLEQEIKEQMQQAAQNLQKNNTSKASDNQKSAGEKMEEMSEKMEETAQENEAENLAEDIHTIRQILDNIVQTSLDQENLLKQTQSSNSVSITNIMRDQKNIKDNVKIIEDSIMALARRQPMVASYISKQVGEINHYLDFVQNDLNNRQLWTGIRYQQQVMTKLNDLALMLAESMKQMKQKQNANSSCSKSGSCKNDGKGNNPSKQGNIKRAQDLQEQLNRQMEALKKQLQQQGNMPKGESGTPQNMNEQFARMAAQQEAIRRIVEQQQNAVRQQNGVGDKALDQLMKEMEKTEKELVNKVLTEQTMNRQKNIETRLLESQKAEKKQDKDNQRKSVEATDIKNLNPPEEWKMDKTKQVQTEMLKTISPHMNYFYKDKVNQYFYNIDPSK